MSADVSEVRAASIIRALMMEASRTSETSVDIQLRTRQYIPEDPELHIKADSLQGTKAAASCLDNAFWSISLDTKTSLSYWINSS
jgi:hypothetical protein